MPLSDSPTGEASGELVSDGLHRGYLLSIFAVNPDGTWSSDSLETVTSAASDVVLEAQSNWESPFAALGLATAAPLFAALVQNGSLRGSALAPLSAFLPEFEDLQGKTAITTLNSTQVFTAAMPIKVSATLHFRAWKDPDAEVRAPVDRLMRWALPQFLSDDGFLQSWLVENRGFTRSLFPSRAPQIVGLSYGKRTMSPMVIETVQLPLSVPLDSLGRPLRCSLQIALSSLTAIDQQKWAEKWSA